MEDRKTQATTSLSSDDSDVAKCALPEGAVARLGRGILRDMAFSPDGQHFAMGTSVGLWLYDLPTLSPIALWETGRGHVHDVTFSPDGLRIAAHPREALTVWDIQRGICLAEMELTKKSDRFGFTKPVFSQDGKRLVAFNKRAVKIQVWCPRTGTQLSETEVLSTYKVYPTCFSPDLNLVAGTCLDKDNQTVKFIAVWCMETGKQIACLDRSEKGGRRCFSPCGRFLAAGGSEGRIQVWDVETGNLEETYTKHEDTQMHPYYPPEGGLIAAGVFPSQSKIEIWDLAKDEKVDTFEYQNRPSPFVRFSERGTQLAYTDNYEIKIWTKARSTDQRFSTIQGPVNAVGSLVFAPDEKTLVVTYWGRKAFLWDVSNQCVRHPTKNELPNSPRNVYPTSSGKILAVGGDENILEICEFGSSESVAEISVPEPGLSRVTGTDAFALTGQRLARAGMDHNIYVWEYKRPSNDMDKSGNWEKCATLIGHPTYIMALAFSPNGKRLSSISITPRSQERTALLWDVDAGKQIAQLPLTVPEQRGYNSNNAGITFSPDGNIIAGGLWNEIVLWDATDGKTLMTIPQSEENQRPIALRFSPCGQYLAAGAWWKNGLKKVSICLWEVATGKKIATFWGHTSDVHCFAFSADGTLLVSGGYDGVIYLWDMEPYL